MSESPCCGSCPCNDCTCDDNPNCPNFEKRSLFWTYQPQYYIESPFGETYWSCPVNSWMSYEEAVAFRESEFAYYDEISERPFRIARKIASEEEVYDEGPWPRIYSEDAYENCYGVKKND